MNPKRIFAVFMGCTLITLGAVFALYFMAAFVTWNTCFFEYFTHHLWVYLRISILMGVITTLALELGAEEEI